MLIHNRSRIVTSKCRKTWFDFVFWLKSKLGRIISGNANEMDSTIVIDVISVYLQWEYRHIIIVRWQTVYDYDRSL